MGGITTWQQYQGPLNVQPLRALVILCGGLTADSTGRMLANAGTLNFAGHLSLLPTLNAPLTDAPLAEQLVIDCERKLGILRLGIGISGAGSEQI